MSDIPAKRNMREKMDAEEFHRSGLLYYVNSTVLWPLGLALAVSIDEKTKRYRKRLELLVVEPPETITDGDPAEVDHPRYRAVKAINARLAAMPSKEHDLAMELLQDPRNVAAFVSSDDPDNHRMRRPRPD